MCYQITKAFPKSEMVGLASPLQRAAVSIPADIAEGRAWAEFGQHVDQTGPRLGAGNFGGRGIGPHV